MTSTGTTATAAIRQSTATSAMRESRGTSTATTVSLTVWPMSWWTAATSFSTDPMIPDERRASSQPSGSFRMWATSRRRRWSCRSLSARCESMPAAPSATIRTVAATTMTATANHVRCAGAAGYVIAMSMMPISEATVATDDRADNATTARIRVRIGASSDHGLTVPSTALTCPPPRSRFSSRECRSTPCRRVRLRPASARWLRRGPRARCHGTPGDPSSP